MGETYSRQPRAAPNFLLWAAKWWSSFGILFSRKKKGNQNQQFSERFRCCSGREEEEFPAKTHSVFIFLSKNILPNLSSWPCSPFYGNFKIVSARFFGRHVTKKNLAPLTLARVAKNRSPALNFFSEGEASWYALLFLLLFSFAAARLWPQGRTEEEEEEEELEEDYRGSVARGWLRQDIQRFSGNTIGLIFLRNIVCKEKERECKLLSVFSI